MSAQLKMHMNYDLFSTPLPNAFIDDFMPESSPAYAMVYILAFRHCFYNGSTSFGIKELSESLHLLESDVINAWHYWEKQGLIKIHYDSKDGFSIEFLTVEPKPKDKKEPPAQIAKPVKAFKINLATQPSYSPAEIDIYMERSDEIRGLFKSAEAIFAKPLTYTELNMILSFFEWYALPIDVIEVMLDYCISNNKKGKNYLETVARDWSENNITTVQAARDYIDTFTVYAKILKAFGITGKTPNKKQIAFMKQWLYDYKLPMDIILEACENTFLQTGKAKFEYAHKILTDWSANQVKNMDDVNRLNEIYQETKKTGQPDKSQKQKPSTYKNRFNNYEQREWDFDKIEKLAHEKLMLGNR